MGNSKQRVYVSPTITTTTTTAAIPFLIPRVCTCACVVSVARNCRREGEKEEDRKDRGGSSFRDNLVLELIGVSGEWNAASPISLTSLLISM